MPFLEDSLRNKSHLPWEVSVQDKFIGKEPVNIIVEAGTK
ncbi:2709_t:CDS:2 [Funneliformis geosporum]|uniref:2709_t:CDS:1 n=1 Tax=Funneliformis geosporum TaxID=1117311 RepID=A0A9W4SUV6_9GLOM|nr:2709_t:CDS:2 [Funneliformis geosporum]